MTKGHRYDAIIQRIFEERYRADERRVSFERQAIVKAAEALGIAAPKNLGDMLYTYRNRRSLPEAVARCAPEGMVWEIRGTGRGTYAFVAVTPLDITPSPHVAVTRIPNATPGMVSMYSLTDEQAMLARIRYNRLVDIFTKVTCYPLQSHLRTAVRGVQVETDDLMSASTERGRTMSCRCRRREIGTGSARLRSSRAWTCALRSSRDSSAVRSERNSLRTGPSPFSSSTGKTDESWCAVKASTRSSALTTGTRKISTATPHALKPTPRRTGR